MIRYTRILTVALMMVATGGSAMAATPAVYGPNRFPAAPDVVLQENAAALGVDGWTVLAAVDIAAAARIDMDRLFATARAARVAFHDGKGSEQNMRKAGQAFRDRARQVMQEIEGLLNAEQGQKLKALVRAELRAEMGG